MNDTMVTVVGNVVDSPRRAAVGNGAVTNFRMASTARRYDAARNEFVDGGTLWIDVECWNTLGGNVSASVSKGDPVIVHGALTTHEWESDNGPRSKPRIKAFAVGPNLGKGRSSFTRDRVASRAGEPVAPGPGVPEQPASTSFAASHAGPSTSVDDIEADDIEADDIQADDIQPGRDYLVEGETLQDVETDLPLEPAHA